MSGTVPGPGGYRQREKAFIEGGRGSKRLTEQGQAKVVRTETQVSPVPNAPSSAWPWGGQVSERMGHWADGGSYR